MTKLWAPDIKSLEQEVLVAGIDLNGAVLKQATPMAYAKERSNRDLFNNDL